MTRALSNVNKKLREENNSLKNKLQCEEEKYEEILLEIRNLRKEKEYWKQIAENLGFKNNHSESRPPFCSPIFSKKNDLSQLDKNNIKYETSPREVNIVLLPHLE